MNHVVLPPHVSLAHLTALEARPTELVHAAADAGFRQIGLRLLKDSRFPEEPDHDPGPAGSAGFRRLQDTLRSRGVSVLDVEVIRLWPDTDLATFLPLLEKGATLGASRALLLSNDPDRTRNADRIAGLAEAALPLGIDICVEFVAYNAIRSFTEAADIIEESGARNARLLIDTLHFCRAGGDLSELCTPRGQLVSYVQICDGPATPPADLLPEGRSNRLFPGEGGLPLHEILDALPRDLPLSVEVPNVALAATACVSERASRAAAAMRTFLAQRSH